METDNDGTTDFKAYEDALFLNMDARTGSFAINTTAEPNIINDETSLLNGADDSRRLEGQMMQVNRGDTLDLLVNAYHTGTYADNGNVGQSVMINYYQYAGGVASAPEGSEALNIYNGVNDATAAAAIFVGDEGNSNAPRAYLNYILLIETLTM